MFQKEAGCTNRHNVLKKLEKIEKITVYPEVKRGYFDVFKAEDIEKIRSYRLDVILRHGFNIIKGEILHAARYGIWSYHHADNSVNRGQPPAFWEILDHQPYVGVTLQRLTEQLDGGFVIEKGYFNPHWSVVKTQNRIKEGGIILLLKSLDTLARGYDFHMRPSGVYYNPLYKTPGLIDELRYVRRFYGEALSRVWRGLNAGIFKARYNKWTLFIGRGSFLNATLYRLKPVKVPDDQFWADPFIFEYKGNRCVFFELFDYKKKRGRIACGRIHKNTLIDITEVLEKPYHLSYPYIFEEDGEIYLMPETHESKRLELYQCIEFPSKWRLVATAFEGEETADPFFFTDQEGTRWLFINKKSSPGATLDTELYIYQVPDLSLKNLVAHEKNPVIVDARRARNAGAIFLHNGRFYRPSQANVYGAYGKALNINEIKRLTLEEYEEETLVTVWPNFRRGLSGIHHLHQTDGWFVFDAAYKRIGGLG